MIFNFIERRKIKPITNLTYLAPTLRKDKSSSQQRTRDICWENN